VQHCGDYVVDCGHLCLEGKVLLSLQQEMGPWVAIPRRMYHGHLVMRLCLLKGAVGCCAIYVLRCYLHDDVKVWNGCYVNEVLL